MSQKSATIALIQNNKVLLLKRGTSAPWQPDKFCLVGGGVDKKESLKDAAIREAFEEVSVIISKENVKYYRIKFNNGYSKLVFYSFIDSQEILLNFEHSEYRWLNFADCVRLHKQKKLVPRLIRTLRVLNNKGILL